MKYLKKLIYLIIGFTIYIAVFFAPFFVVPNIVKWFLHFFTLNGSTYSMLFSLVVTVIAFILCSDSIYTFLHDSFCSLRARTKNQLIDLILFTLISVNDVYVAFPKKTFLYVGYLIVTVLDKLGIWNTNADILFVGVVIIGIDRVTKTWNAERGKIHALGRKAYSDNGDINDSIVQKR